MSNDIPFLPSAQTPLTRPGCRQQLPRSLGLQPLTKFVEECLHSKHDFEMATLKINKWIKISYCHCRRILYILCHRKINPVYQRRVVKWYSPFVMSRKARSVAVRNSFRGGRRRPNLTEDFWPRLCNLQGRVYMRASLSQR